MSRFAHTITQIAFVAAASLSSLVMMQASTASAQAPGSSYFTAELAAPVEKTTKIIQGVVKIPQHERKALTLDTI